MNQKELLEFAQELAYLKAENMVMRQSLKQIVACDYRGNMPTEQSIAKQTLEQLESFRAKFVSQVG